MLQILIILASFQTQDKTPNQDTLVPYQNYLYTYTPYYNWAFGANSYYQPLLGANRFAYAYQYRTPYYYYYNSAPYYYNQFSAFPISPYHSYSNLLRHLPSNVYSPLNPFNYYQPYNNWSCNPYQFYYGY